MTEENKHIKEDQVDKRKLKGLKTREHILNTCAQIILNHGANALTTRNIVKESGVGKGSLYHHFENLEAIIFHSTLLIHDYYQNSIQDMKVTNAKEFLENLGYLTVDTLIESSKANKKSSTLFDIILNNDAYTKKVNEKSNETIQILSDKLEEGLLKENKQIEKSKIDYLALSSYTFLGGLKLSLFLNPDKDFFYSMWKNTVNMFLSYIDD